MHDEEDAAPINEAVSEFNRHERRTDAERVAASLSAGLTVLRSSFYQRLHADVQRIVGMDSMLAPVSLSKSKTLTKVETEIYQSAESRVAVAAAGYVSDAEWYGQWLLQLRLGRVAEDPRVKERIAYYATRKDRDRRLAFSSLLAKVLPESRRVPLILFSLFPLSVQIATARAFGDNARAAALRDEQVEQLPAILDCHDCHGGLLENGQQCRACANPLWKWEVLAAV